MQLVQDEAFDQLFRSFARSAFHLEVEDTYRTPDEAGPLAAFLAGRPDDLHWHRAWLDLVRDVVSGGRSVARVRVVTVPHVDYTQWGLTIAPHNIAAGEDVRWLPRQLVAGDELTTDDFWLFDDERVAFTVFEPDGRFAGGATTEDPVIVDRCRRARDRAWDLAIPHERYVARGRRTG